MAFWNWFRQSEQVDTKPFAIARGQLARDPNIPTPYATANWFAALRREQRLWHFDWLMRNVPICEAIVSTLDLLCNTDFSADTGDAILDREINSVLYSIGIDKVNSQLFTNALTSGFAIGEYVLSDDLTELEKIVVLDSTWCRLVMSPDRSGEVQSVLQYPRIMTGNRVPPMMGRFPGAIEIPANKVLRIERRGKSFDQVYGTSIFQTICGAIEHLSEYYAIALNVGRKFGSPRYMVEVNPDGFATQEEFSAALNIIKTELAKAEADETIIMPPAKMSIIGAESSRLKLTDEFRQTLSNIISVSHIPAAVLGFETGRTEAYSRQTILVLSSILRHMQMAIANEYTRTLAPVLSAIYGFPAIRGFRFASPRLTEQLLEQQSREKQRSLDLEDVKVGLISPETFASRSWGGVSEIFDRETFDQQIELLRQSPPSISKGDSPDENDNALSTDIPQSTKGE